LQPRQGTCLGPLSSRRGSGADTDTAQHRTGCVIGVVRKLSGWALTDIISEYEAYAEPKARACDIKYITGFELANISSLSREAASSPFRSFAFLRASIFALVMLAVWLVSGSRIAAARGAPPPQRKPPGEAGRGI
jgi:tyrosine-protein phosphatase SIW14